MKNYDLIVVGSGLAGLYAALVAGQYGEVLLLSKSELRDCNTAHAQGGIAAALLPSDSPELHYRDTLIAGDGLCDPRAVRVLVEEGPARVRHLIDLGVPFDREGGELAVTREGAHSQARVLHAGGDASGARIEATMVERVRACPRVTVRENQDVCDLVLENGRVRGVRALDEGSGLVGTFAGDAVLLATGGAGQLFSQTTNPAVATGDGIAVAFRAGAKVANLEFVQFHPTALMLPGAPRFLISEAVRGEGGILRNSAGERFMERYDPRGELASRDVVARAIVFEMRRTGDPSAYLDVTHLGGYHVRRRFPTIARVCEEHDIDVGRVPIPVAPAAHYLMGGIRTNPWGETSLPGLFACGECACTGIHGANRLASNSLLETIVFSGRAVERHFGVAPANPPGDVPAVDEVLAARRVTIPAPRRAERGVPTAADLQNTVWQNAGLLRDGAGLERLATTAEAWQAQMAPAASRADLELANLILLARLVATAGLLREESRGGHYRVDFPEKQPSWRREIVMVDQTPETVAICPDQRGATSSPVGSNLERSVR